MNLNVPFIDHLNAVDDILEQRYGVTSDDTGMEAIAAGQEAGEAPEAVAEGLAERYGLVRIDAAVCE